MISSLEKKFLSLINFLNIDIALGACAISLLGARFFQVSIPFYAYLLLFLAVFCIYLVDHLFDSLKIHHITLPERRQFYFDNRKILFIISLLTIISGSLIALINLPFPLLKEAVFLSTGCFFYLLYGYLFKAKPIPKELFVASLYVCGTMFYTLSVVNTPHHISSYFFLISLFAIAFENLLTYSIIDFPEDEKLGFISFSTTYGLIFCKRLCIFIFILNFSLLFWHLKINPEKWVYILLLTVIHAAQLFVYLQRKKLNKYAFYRWIGDGAFMLPFTLIFID